MRESLVSIGQIAKMFDVTRDAPIKWRIRYASFPKPVTTNPWPMYEQNDVLDWYKAKWPAKAGQLTARLHRYRVEGGQVTDKTTTEMGTLEQARGYLKAVQSLEFADWRIYSTQDGFSAHQGNVTEVWALDVVKDRPAESWHYYDTRFKTGGTPQ